MKDMGDVMKMLLNGDGWDRLEQLPKTMADDRKRQSDELRAEAELLAAPFRTVEGRRALEVLFTKTILRPLVLLPIEGAPSAETQAMYACFRQGQNQIVTMIINALSVADGEPPKMET